MAVGISICSVTKLGYNWGIKQTRINAFTHLPAQLRLQSGICRLYLCLCFFNLTQLTGHWIIDIYLWEKSQSFSKKRNLFQAPQAAAEKVFLVGIRKKRKKKKRSLGWWGALSAIMKSNCSLNITTYDETIVNFTKYT